MEINILGKSEAKGLIKEQTDKVQENLFAELDKVRGRVLKLEEEMRLVLKYYNKK